MNYSTHLFRHLRSNIGNNIQNQRKKQKLTLQKLSYLSGISEKLLDCYELGKYEIKLHELLKISCVLKLEVVDLLRR